MVTVLDRGRWVVYMKSPKNIRGWVEVGSTSETGVEITIQEHRRGEVEGKTWGVVEVGEIEGLESDRTGSRKPL